MDIVYVTWGRWKTEAMDKRVQMYSCFNQKGKKTIPKSFWLPLKLKQHNAQQESGTSCILIMYYLNIPRIYDTIISCRICLCKERNVIDIYIYDY